MTPTPNQLFALYERGEIEREELHALMAVHARELISEMEEDYLWRLFNDPVKAISQTFGRR